MAIWDYFEGELDIDGRFDAPETEDVLDCVKFDSETAEELLTAFDWQNLNELADEVASDWDLPAQEVLKGFETILSHLKQVSGNGFLLYEMV
ncbi:MULTISPECIES: hypothetical protein [Terrabacteria group]|uniref:hypothetical protein n=1 Tax=Bacillati TaxID=1783272 RepID=UPI001C6F2947|nr:MULTISPECIES: hypothetical protein [Terrabacteria group]MBW9213015.1 hypothetical protein [Trueperella sp. zg.1013]